MLLYQKQSVKGFFPAAEYSAKGLNIETCSSFCRRSAMAGRLFDASRRFELF